MENKRRKAVIIGIALAVMSFAIIGSSVALKQGNKNVVAETAPVEESQPIIDKKLVMTSAHDEATLGKNTYVDMEYVNLNTKMLGTSITVEEKSQEMQVASAQENTTVSRGTVDREPNGEYLDWWKQVRPMIMKDSVLTVKDVETELMFNVKYSYGTNHMDTEPMSKADSEIIKQIWGGNYNWERRAVKVYFQGRVIAASMVSYPHAGLDDESADTYVKGRSGGYGAGTNLDKVKDNGVDGVMCIHFKNSTRHLDNRSDSKHQSQVKKAAGVK